MRISTALYSVALLVFRAWAKTDTKNCETTTAPAQSDTNPSAYGASAYGTSAYDTLLVTTTPTSKPWFSDAASIAASSPPTIPYAGVSSNTVASAGDSGPSVPYATALTSPVTTLPTTSFVAGADSLSDTYLSTSTATVQSTVTTYLPSTTCEETTVLPTTIQLVGTGYDTVETQVPYTTAYNITSSFATTYETAVAASDVVPATTAGNQATTTSCTTEAATPAAPDLATTTSCTTEAATPAAPDLATTTSCTTEAATPAAPDLATTTSCTTEAATPAAPDLATTTSCTDTPSATPAVYVPTAAGQADGSPTAQAPSASTLSVVVYPTTTPAVMTAASDSMSMAYDTTAAVTGPQQQTGNSAPDGITFGSGALYAALVGSLGFAVL